MRTHLKGRGKLKGSTVMCVTLQSTNISVFPVSNKRTSIPFILIHSDIWGPSAVPNISGACWSASFIEDCTCMMRIFLLKNKSDVSLVFQNFFNMIQTQFGAVIKQFRPDNARYYFTQTLFSFFQQHGIIHELSCTYTPQQNGVPK